VHFWLLRNRMSESLTYGSVGGPVGQPPALPGTTSLPSGDSAESEKSRLGSSRCALALCRLSSGAINVSTNTCNTWPSSNAQCGCNYCRCRVLDPTAPQRPEGIIASSYLGCAVGIHGYGNLIVIMQHVGWAVQSGLGLASVLVSAFVLVTVLFVLLKLYWQAWTLTNSTHNN
jgi:hypothetical protein